MGMEASSAAVMADLRWKTITRARNFAGDMMNRWGLKEIEGLRFINEVGFG